MGAGSVGVGAALTARPRTDVTKPATSSMSHRRPIRGHGDFGAPAFVPLTAHVARPSDAIDARQNGTSGRHDGGFGTSRASASATRVYEHLFGYPLPVADLSATCARSHCLRGPWTFRCGSGRKRGLSREASTRRTRRTRPRSLRGHHSTRWGNDARRPIPKLAAGRVRGAPMMKRLILGVTESLACGLLFLAGH